MTALNSLKVKIWKSDQKLEKCQSNQNMRKHEEFEKIIVMKAKIESFPSRSVRSKVLSALGPFPVFGTITET